VAGCWAGLRPTPLGSNINGRQLGTLPNREKNSVPSSTKTFPLTEPPPLKPYKLELTTTSHKKSTFWLNASSIAHLFYLWIPATPPLGRLGEDHLESTLR